MLTFIFTTSWALATPLNLNYQGRLFDADNEPIDAGFINVTFQVLDPSGQCLLFEETHSMVDMTAASGYFSLQVGDGTQNTSTAPNFSLPQSLSNATGLSDASMGCATDPFVPGPADHRRLRVKINGETLVPDQTIESTAYSMFANDARQLEGNSIADIMNQVETDYLRLDGANTSTTLDVGGTRVVNAADPTGPQDLATRGWVSGQISASGGGDFLSDGSIAATGNFDLDGNSITDLADPSAAQDAATKNYVDTEFYSQTNLQTSGSASIHFDNLTNLPTGLADGDNDTTALSSMTGNSDDIGQGSTNLFLTGTERDKLTNIEANASADMTAGEILTAISSVDGASSGLDADALDGASGAFYLDYTNFTNTPSIPSSLAELTGGLDDNSDALAVTINSSENVGIGTTSPAAKLDTNGTIRALAGTTPSPTTGTGIELQYAISNGFIRAYDRDSSSYENLILQGRPLRFSGTDGTEDMRIDTSGNVGIGTTSPAYELDVIGDVKGTQLCIGSDCRSAWPGAGGGGTVTSIGLGTGIPGSDITGSGTINVVGGDGIVANADDIAVDLATNPGLEFDSNQLRAKIGSGMIRDASGLSVDDGVGAGQILAADDLSQCTSNQKLQWTVSSGWSCVTDNDTTALSAMTGNSDNIAQGSSNLFMTSAERDKLGLLDRSSLDATDGTPVDALYVDNDGNVGIGTNTPSQALDVNGDISVLGLLLHGDSGEGDANVRQTTAGDPLVLQANGGDIILGQDGSNDFVVKSDGTVGIGGDPSSLLDIRDDSGNAVVTLGRVTSGSVSGADLSLGRVRWFNSSVASAGPNEVASIDTFSANGNGSGGYLTISTHTGTGAEGSGPTERVRIDKDGMVGIGTTSPAYELEVIGDVKGTQLCIGSDCRSAWPGAGGGGTVTSIGLGTGIPGSDITGSGTINVVGGDGIVANADDIAVDLATNPGLEFDSNQLRAKIGSGMIRDASGLSVDDGVGTGQILAADDMVQCTSNQKLQWTVSTGWSCVSDVDTDTTYSASDMMTAIQTLDTNSSGLNADTLDGQQGSHYLNYANLTGTPTIPTSISDISTGIDDSADALAVTIDSSENVGIGTTSPSVDLHIDSGSSTTVRIDTNHASLNPSLVLGNSGNSTPQGTQITYNNSTGESHFNNIYAGTTAFHFESGEFGSSTKLLTISNDGGVGIGGITPNSAYKLDINLGNDDVRLSGTSSGGANGLVLDNTSGTDQSWFIATAGDSSSMGSPHSLIFRDMTTGETRMNIDTTGNVGIGTTSPSAKLHINELISPSVTSPVLVLDGNYSDGTSAQSIDFRINGESNGAARVVVPTDGSTGELAFYTTTDFASVPPTEKIRIDENGNVGIGTTSPAYELEVVGDVKGTQLCIGADCRSSWPSGGGGDLLANGSVAMSANFDMGSGANRIVDLADPSSAQDAATKNYVDGKTWTLADISDEGTMAAQNTTSYYNQTNMQTSGQSQLHWNNLINKPGFLSDNDVDWSDIQGIPADIADGDADTTYSNATGGAAGLMSAADKSKLDDLDGHSLDASDGNPTNALMVDTAGNVGIGTTSPSQSLQVESGNIFNVSGVYIADSTNSSVFSSDQHWSTGMGFTNSATPDILFSAEGAELVRIKRTGKIGLNVTDPNGLLHVYGNGPIRAASIDMGQSNGGALMQGVLDADNAYARAFFGHNAVWNSSTDQWDVENVGANDATGILIPDDGGFHFINHISTGSTDRSLSHSAFVDGTKMIIDRLGNVGIGTTSPDAQLHVDGDVKIGNSSATCNSTTEGSQRYNSTGKLMEFCNGTDWAQIGGGGPPAGAVQAFAQDSCPTGWLAADGDDVSRTTYADLYAAIGVMYGDGNTTTTFDLPDYRGYFLRGWDDGAGRDPDSTGRSNRGDGTTGDNVGTTQADEFKEHDHEIPYSTSSNTYYWGTSGGYNAGFTLPGSRDTSDEGGEETRPVNINVLYCIKY